METELFFEECGQLILPPWEMGRGYGFQRVLGILNGCYVVATRERAYRVLCCGRVITSHFELAGSCDVCRELFEQSGTPSPEWASQVCRSCGLVRCNGACKGKLCPCHAYAVGDLFYCARDFLALRGEAKSLEKRMQFQERVRKYGAMLAHGEEFLNSLFWWKDERKS